MEEEAAKLNPAEAWAALHGGLTRGEWRRDGRYILSGNHVIAEAATEAEANILYLLLARSGPRLLEAYRELRDAAAEGAARNG